MQTTVEFLDALKAHLKIPSDYQLAKHLKITRSQVSVYRRRGDRFSDTTAVRAAELLELDPAYVLACIAAERTKCEPARKALTKLAKNLRMSAAERAAAHGDH